MFDSNIFSQRNPYLHSQSCYDGPVHPSLFESYNHVQCNPLPIPGANIPSQSHNNNPIVLNQLNSNINNGRKGPPQPFYGINFINFKQFENIFIEKIKNFPLQVNDYLTKEEENINLKLLMDSVNNISSATFQNINKINETYCNKLTNSNIAVQKLFEICSQINEILSSMDNELINQFNSLTNFHGYDESIQNEEENNLIRIKNGINECSDILSEQIIKTNEKSMNFNNELNANCEQFRIMLSQELMNLNTNLNELIKYKNEKNNEYEKFQKIANDIIIQINSLKNKFIFVNSNTEDKNNNNENIIETKEEEKNDPGVIKANNPTISDEVQMKNRIATLKYINEMHNRRKKKNKKF